MVDKYVSTLLTSTGTDAQGTTEHRSVAPREVKHRTTSNFTVWYTPQRTENRDQYVDIHSTTDETWKQPKCPSTDEQVCKMWSIHAMERYSAKRRNKVQYTVWMILENTALIPGTEGKVLSGSNSRRYHG